MQTIELGHTGIQVSRMALGCMLMGTATDETTSFALLDRYVEAGGNFLDTADCYAWWLHRETDGGQSEELLGRWLARRGRRDGIVLATKGSAKVRDVRRFWGAGDDPNFDAAFRNFEGAGAATLQRAVDDSLRRLGTDHIDLYYVHVDDRATPLEETLEALDAIVRAGKVRHIGWSNVHTWRLERIRQLCARHGWTAPVALQQQHSYLRRRPGLEDPTIVDAEQLDYLRAHDDLTLVAYSPILKGIYDDPAKRPGHHIMASYEGPDAQARLAAVEAMAREVGATPNQVVLAWLLAQSTPRMVALIGPRTLEQFSAAMPAADLKLDAGQLARLDTAGA